MRKIREKRICNLDMVSTSHGNNIEIIFFKKIKYNINAVKLFALFGRYPDIPVTRDKRLRVDLPWADPLNLSPA